MRKIFFFTLTIFLFACGNPQKQVFEKKEAKGGRVYGGTLHLNEADGYVTLFPHGIADAMSQNIASQIYEGLVKFNSKNITEVKPCIAESWDADASGTVYTFKLKKSVMFQDDKCFSGGKGREVKASDFKYCLQLACTFSPDNQIFSASFKGLIKGADEFFEESKRAKPAKDVSGIQVIDDYSLRITLTSPSTALLYLLAGPAGYVFPREAIEQYGNKTTVGTGPFIFTTAEKKDAVFLVKNPSYHGMDSLGNQLPFLDSINITFIPDKKKELQAFKDGNLDAISGLPSEAISEMVEQQIADFHSKNPKYILVQNPDMRTEYYEFNISRPPFNNVKVRQAFSCAIDKEKLIQEALNSEAFGPGVCGLTPPGMEGYDITSIKGYGFAPEKAKKLFAEAGYPNGKNFPHITVELNSGGGKHERVAEEMQKQLKEVLNVSMDFNVVSFSQKLEDMKYAKADIFRGAWVADYPSPENFLRLFYGVGVPDSLSKPSYPNTLRYKNPEFDKLFEKGLSAKNKTEAYSYFQQAENLAMQDAPLLILLYGQNIKMIHSYLKNFYFNPMNYDDFSEVFILKPAAEKPKP